MNSGLIATLEKPIGIVSINTGSTEHYWLHKLIERGQKGVILFKNRKDINSGSFDAIKTLIIIRYLNDKYLNELKKFKEEGKRSILLIDDNILKFNITNKIGIRYSLKLWWKIGRYRSVLSKYISEIWSTTKSLEELNKKILDKNKFKFKTLKLEYKIRLNKESRIYRITYLGTSSHKKEFIWLKTLFERLQLKRKDCIIEIVADRKIGKMFKDIPRVKIIQPMDWETFKLDISNREIDVFLVPIFESMYNNYRSATKIFECTSLKAVGLYSNRKPYNQFINDEINGYLLDNKEEIWLKKINWILDNKEIREKIVKNAISDFSNKSTVAS